MSELLTRDDFVSLISMMIKPRMPVDYPAGWKIGYTGIGADGRA